MQTELSSNPCPQKSNGGDLFMSKFMYCNIEFYKRAPNTVLQMYKERKLFILARPNRIKSTGELLKTQCSSIPQQLNESLGFRPEKYFLSFLGDLNVQQRLRITIPI